jgi:hypothetical protein
MWTVICSHAVVDTDSNNVSLQNVLEEIQVMGTPTPQAQIPMPFDIMTTWIRSDPDTPCRGKMRLAFVLPSGETFGSSVETKIDLTESERHRQKVHFLGLPIVEPGRHFARVELLNEGESEWRQVAHIPLTITFQPPTERQTEG